MPYLIDGHNLISYLDDLDLDDPNDEAKLVIKLRGYTARTQKKCVVVFDHGLPGGSSRLSTTSVKVIFASAGATNADRIIMERIRETRDRKGWFVVSSDNEVLAAAEQHGLRGIRSVEFAEMLKQPQKPGVDTAANAYVSPKEVNEWLEVFGDDDPDYKRSTFLDGLPPPSSTIRQPKQQMPQPEETPIESEPAPEPPKPKHEQPKSVGKYARRSPKTEDKTYNLSDDDLDLWKRTYGSYKRSLKEESNGPSIADLTAKPAPKAPDKKRKKSRGDDIHRKGDPHLSQDEISDWLSMFGEDED